MHRHTPNLGWLWLLASVVVACLPAQAQVVPDATLGAGKNSITTTTGDRTDITGGLRRSSALFHSFDRFSILTNQQVYFANPTGVRNIFSRVTGSSVSNIDGLLGVSGSANLFFMNPNGIIFGPNARLDVGGSFLATTANVLEFADGQKFAADGDRAVPLVEVNIPIGLQIAANSPAMLNNQGNLAVNPGQSLTLAGGNTTHTGTLTAPGGMVQVLGNQVTLADQARVDVSSPTGGGTVLIGGDYRGQGSLLNSTQTVVGPGVSINASATGQGNGGKVIIWSDGNTRFAGTIAAQGGPQGGDGGFVEVSGKQNLNFRGFVSTAATYGQSGTVLLDPASITIVASGADLNGDGTPGDDITSLTDLDNAANFPGANSFITNTALNGLLTGSNTVILAATNKVDVNASVTGAGNANLTLNAPTVNLNQPITLAGSGVLSGTATTVNVGTAGRIQNGVDVAATGPTIGSNVNVAPGSYTETVTVNKPLNLAFAGTGATVTGSLTTNNPIGLFGNLTTTGGSQTYNSTVDLGTDSTLAGGTIAFANTVNGNHALTITGDATFGSTVGNAINLTSLNVSGTTALNGGNVTTTGNQTYTGAVTLGANTTLAGATIDFGNTVNGGRTLGVNGNATFGGAVGNTTGLTSVNVSGTTQINGGSIRTTGDQTYNNATTLAGNTQLNSNNGNITLNQVDGAASVTAPLNVTTTGDVTFKGVAGGTQPLGTVNVSGAQRIAVAGTAAINTANGNDITLNGGTVIVSGGSLVAGSVSSSGGQVSLTGNQVLLTGSGSIQARAATINSSPLPLSKDTNFQITTFDPFTLPTGTIPATTGSSYSYTNINVFNDTDGTGGLTPAYSPALLAFIATFQPALATQLQQSQTYYSPTILWIPSATLNAFPGSQTVSLTASNNIAIGSSTPVNLNFPAGSGGIVFNAANSFSMNSVDRIRTNGRDIAITASSLNIGSVAGPRPVIPASNIDASLPAGPGAGGVVTLTGTAALNLTNSRISTDATGNASGGAIVLNSNGTITADNAALDSRTLGSQQGGTISLTAPTVTLLNNSQVSASVQTGATGRGGNVVVAASQVNLTNSSLRADTAGTGSLLNPNQGKGGNIIVNTNTLNATGANSGVFATTTSAAAAGSLSFQPQTGGDLAIDVRNGAVISASTTSSGASGNIDLTAPQSVTITGNGSLKAETSGLGKAGSVTVQTPTLNVDGATLSTAATATAPALAAGVDPEGAITLKPFATNSTATLTVNLANGANLTASTAGARQSGSIDISAPQSVTITGDGSLKAETSGSGNAGSVNIRTATLNVTKSTISTGATASATASNADPGGRITIRPLDTSSTATLDVNLDDKATITASTAGARSGGSISVTAPQTVTISGNGVLKAETSGSGDAGEIRVATPDLTLQNGVQLSTSTTGTGQGGSILIGKTNPTDPTTLTFADRVSLNNSRLDAQSAGAGVGGNISVQASDISLVNNALLNAGVLSTGNGGTIDLSTNGGTIALDNSQISTAIESTGTGNGNTITVDTGTLSLVDGARIQSQTSGPGNAGDVQINVGTSFTAAGKNSFGRFSGVLASSEGAASGQGGSIRVNTPTTATGQLTLSDNAFLAANTRGNQDGGNIEVNVAKLELKSGGQILTAASESSSGRAGSIAVNAGEVTIADAVSPPTAPVSPFATLPVIALSDSATPMTVNSPGSGGFAYYSFNVSTGNSQGTFDIDNGYKLGPGSATTSIDTQIFLFNGTTGSLLAENDDSTTDSGSLGLSFFPSLTRDSFLNYTFPQAGRYVIGVGAYPSSVNATAPIVGTAPTAAQTYSLTVALTSPGIGGASNPVNLNPNLPQDNGLFSSGLYASSKGSGGAGSVTVTTPNLTVSNQGTIAASNVSSTGQDIRLQGLNNLTVQGNSQITASTNTGTAGNVIITADQGANPTVNLVNSRVEAAAKLAGGSAGGVSITAPTVMVDKATVSAANVSSSTGGDVSLQNLNTLQVVNGGSIEATTQNGAAGNVNVAANTSVQLNNGSLSVQATGTGQAGTVTVTTPSLTVENAGKILATTQQGGSTTTGNVDLQGLNTLNVRTNGLISASTETGVAGNIAISADQGSNPAVNLNSGRIEAAANQSGGQAGGVSLTTPTLTLVDSTIAASNLNAATGGNITFNALDALAATNSAIVASTETGTAGNVKLNETGNPAASVGLQNSRIAAEATGTGNNPNSRAGNVALNAQTIDLSNASEIATRNVSSAVPESQRSEYGNIQLGKVDRLTVNNSTIAASTQSGNAGSVTVDATQQVNLDNNGRIAAEATQGGSAGSVNITTPDLQIANNGTIAASSQNGAGSAGGVNVTASTVNLSNGAQISAETDQGGASSPANISLQGLQTLNVNNSQISSSTNSGRAGSVAVNAAQQVNLDNNAAIAAEARQGGNAGSVSVTTPNLTVANGAAIAASSRNGAGSAGGVNVTARTVNLSNGAQISAETDQGGASSPANISLQGLQTLNVNNSQVSSSTNRGQAGSVAVNAAQQVNLDNNARIAAEARQGGNAGSVSVTTSNLQIANNASIAASSANGAGTAGGVNVTASTVNLGNGARISAETDRGGAANPANISLQGLQTLNVNNSQVSSSTNSGQAGSVAVTAPGGQINLTGDNGRISAEARQGGTAGNVDLTAGRVVIRDGAQATVSSPQGQAGNLTVTASTLRLDRGTLSAATGGNGTGANITIQGLQTPLFLRNGSLISANAGEQANGGNINIAAPYIIGQTFENSDIVANAVRGSGGRINITTNAIFGLQFRPKLTPLSDITASSEFGTSGVVALNTLNIDPSRGLTQLPTDLVDRTSQISQGCSVGGSEKDSQFKIAGRGGVQISPTALLPAQASTSDWVGLEGPAIATVASTEPRFPDGSLLVLQPGQTYLVQTVCVNSWKQQQRSSL